MNIDGPSQTNSTPTRAPTPVPNDYDQTEFDSPQDGTVTDNANEQLILVSKGQQLAGHLLPTKESIDAIEKKIADVLPDIPAGEKSNICFLVDQTENLARETRGENRQFRDDCGAWVSVRSLTYHYERSTYRQLLVRNNLFCVRKKMEGTVSAVPLETQPPATDVITCLLYTSDAADE